MKLIPTLIVIAVAAVAAVALRLLLRRSEARPAATDALQAKPDTFAAEPNSSPALPAGTPAETPRPEAPAAPEAVPAAAPPAAPLRPAGGKPLILVAEDNPSNYRLVEVLLRRDYDLIHAENGVEAVALFRERRPDLILMDISMPEMDGYEALQGVRALDAEVPVIALTAYAFETDRLQMRDCGFNSSLAKPLDARELKRTIRRELGLDEPDAAQ